MRTKNRLNTAILCLASSLLCASCGNEELAGGNGTDSQAERFTIETRADGESGTTYRIMAYSTAFVYQGTGTYYDAGGTELVPYDPSSEGIKDTDCALRDLSGTYNVVCVSPVQTFNDDGSFNMTIDTDNFTDYFYATSAQTLSLGSNEIYAIGTLEDRHAKIAFNFYKVKDGDSTIDFEITEEEINIIGAGAEGETVKYYPCTRQVVGTENPITIELTADENKTADATTGNTLFYSASAICIPAAIYAPSDGVADRLGASGSGIKETDYLYLSFTMEQNGRTIPVRLPLTSSSYDEYHELLPHYAYTYNIIVSAQYITLTLNVYNPDTTGGSEWEDGGENSSNIDGDYTTDITLGTWKIAGDGTDGWSLIEIDNQAINGTSTTD